MRIAWPVTNSDGRGPATGRHRRRRRTRPIALKVWPKADSKGVRGDQLIGGPLRVDPRSGLDSLSGPSSRAFCLSLSGDEFCAGQMRRQELSGPVQCGGRFVEDRVKGLEDVRHPGGDVEGDLDVGGGGLSRQASSIPSMVTSAVGTAPSAAAVTVTSADSGCADDNSRSSRRCSPTSLPTGKADCRRTASRFSRCSVLTEDLPFGRDWLGSAPRWARPRQTAAQISCREAGLSQPCRQAGDKASPDHGDSRGRSTAEPIHHGQA